MLKALTRTIIIALLPMLLGVAAHAGNRVYQYDGKMPFVKMMLSMMEAMGILDRLPANGRYGRYGDYGLSGYPSSPWQQSPWSQSVWNSPNWGVFPMDSYSPYGYQGNNYQWSAPYWSDSDLSGWVNEPWETSEWNPEAKGPEPAAKFAQPDVPLVQNFHYNAPAPAPQNNTQNDRQNNGGPDKKGRPSKGMNRQSPLSKLAPPRQSARQSARPPAPRSSQRKVSPLGKKSYQKPCITEFCGLKKPNLNGLWVAQNGEMLGVKNKRYLWSDGDSRYLTGQLKIQNEYLLASVEGHEELMRFKYKLAGNHLVTMRPDGTIREFIRMSYNQYQNNYLDYGQAYGQNYGGY